MVKKYGGYVMNFDFMPIKSITRMNSNFLSKCSEDSVEAQPYFLHHNHPLIEEILKNLNDNFNPNSSESIGLDLMTKTLKNVCEVDFLKQLNYKDCSFSPKILPKTSVCPIDNSQYRKLYDPSRTKLMLRKIEESDSLAVKLWTLKAGTENLGDYLFNTTFYALSGKLCPVTMEFLGTNKHF